ncbi:guanine-N(7)-methyltransferase [Sistotremastrum suecicum HHB10207 ss-3]|uniref:mRNA cap guanine-N(7) methyltransferase n=1 Tax=Sistotremastrum suecicum HHB10207 ss-3 TaxID=1314776 RepID=A0A166IVN3_9AGAM|nr:guanine-N(7)-methyltransferase [Sistotremastrum suecicum HHB10207 ss-3]
MPTQVSRPPTTQPLRYEPRNRKTPAGSVLEPLTPAELETYKHSRNPLRIKSTDSITLPSLEEREEVRNTGVLKRRRDGPEDLEPPSKRLKDSVLVAEHYNARQDVGIQQRLESPIIGLKSFNNWIKSVLIAKWAAPSLVPANGRRTNAMFGKILDLGCGKGGDLQKWQKARVKEYYGLDIAATSVEQARFRHQSFRPSQRFHAVFQALDCYSHPLSDVLGPDVLSSPFDVVSMQFCMHYAFQNLAKVRQMLDNVSRWLRVGGRFVGTIPNSEQLLERLKGLPSDAEELSFGNAVYKIQFDNRDIQTYGQRYSFFLKDAVEDVPEYVVHWDNFVELAKEYGLHLLIRKEFHEVFQEEQEHADYGPLLKRMKVVDAQGVSQMDEDQWEAANIYIVFAFEKR